MLPTQVGEPGGGEGLATVGRLCAMLHKGALMADETQPWAASWLTALEQLVSEPSLTHLSLKIENGVLTSATSILVSGDVYLHVSDRACHASYARLG